MVDTSVSAAARGAPQPDEAALVHAAALGELLVVSGIVRGRCLRVAGLASALSGSPDINGCEADVRYMKTLLCAAAHPEKNLLAYLH